MHPFKFFYSSISIFIITFFFGVLLDEQSIRIQKKYDLSPSIAAILQLFVFLSFVYFIQQYNLLHLEVFLPHSIFSTFMFTLQTNMIQNFKITLDLANNKN